VFTNTIDEYRKNVNLLKNKDVSLSLLIHMKL